jgi:hypothetical protein
MGAINGTLVAPNASLQALELHVTGAGAAQ